jgi:serine/threonine-protein kinase
MNVSKGNQPSAVPDVRGQTVTQAKQLLKQAGFTNVSTQSLDGSGSGNGRVVDQSPPAGSTVDSDQQITLLVTKGTSSSNNGLGDLLGN